MRGARGAAALRAPRCVLPLYSGLRGVPWWAGLLYVPVGGGPPASRPRRELRSARRLEARPGPATAHGHRSLALARGMGASASSTHSTAATATSSEPE